MRGTAFLFVALATLSHTTASPLQVRETAVPSPYSPPYFPAPKGGWLADWADSYAKAAKLVDQMTLAEKVNITTAIGAVSLLTCVE